MPSTNITGYINCSIRRTDNVISLFGWPNLEPLDLALGYPQIEEMYELKLKK